MRLTCIAFVSVVCLGLTFGAVVYDFKNTEYGISHRQKRSVVHIPVIGRGRWTRAVVPYSITKEYNKTELRVIHESMDDYHYATCVKFRPTKEGDKHKIHIRKSHSSRKDVACSTYDGMLVDSSQDVLIGSICTRADILRVFGALLGLREEALRPDRDKYITIIYKNIDNFDIPLFEKYHPRSVNTMGTPYDYLSLMHFKYNYKSKNRLTTINATLEWLYLEYRMGGEVLSFGDVEGIDIFYNCIALLKCPMKACPGRGFIGRDCKCWCPGHPIDYCDTKKPVPGIRKDPSANLKDVKVKIEIDFGCFPGDALVTTGNGDVTEMKNLEAGQNILTVRDGKRVFSEVKTFLKRRPGNNVTYVTLTTDQGNHVSLSADHLIFAATNDSSIMKARLARDVKPGDYLYSTTGCPHAVCHERVIEISLSRKEGIFVPMTDEGTLVVNGILASCYTTFSHDLAHVFMTPFRWFPWLLASHQQDGYSPLIPIIKAFGRLAFANSLL